MVYGFLGRLRRKAKKVLLFQDDDRTKSTLHLKIVNSVVPNASIYSDCWKDYNDLHKNEYKHKTVNHSKFFKNPGTGVHPNIVDGTWSALKKHVSYGCKTCN